MAELPGVSCLGPSSNVDLIPRWARNDGGLYNEYVAHPARRSSGDFDNALETVKKLEPVELIHLADVIAARLEELEDSLPLSDYAQAEIKAARKDYAAGRYISLDEFLRKHA